MSDAPIHDLPPASSVAASDVVPIDQGLVTRKATMTQISAAVGPINVGVGIHGANNKTTPIDPDELGLVDTADGNTLKKLTWGNLKATLAALTSTWNISTTGNAGSATKLQTARTIDATSFDGTANVTVVAPAIHAATNKTTPVDADETGIYDSVSGLLNKVTWANIKTTLAGTFTTIASLAATGGSALVGFIQAGVGAVLRTGQSKMRDIVSVKDFGAVGDGLIDDTTAIQSALDSGASSVFIPAGTYKITTGLSVPYGVSMYGEGGTASVISCLSCNGLNFKSASYDNGNMFYEDFGLVGHAGSTPNWGAVESLLPAGGTSGVDSRDGLHFSRLKIGDFNCAFTISDTWQWTVTDCLIHKVNQAFLLGPYTISNRIMNNIIVYEGGDSFGGNSHQYAIELTAPPIEGLVITGNQIFGFARAFELTAGVFIDILHNDISATEYAFYITTVNNILNIKDNYIEMTDAGAISGIREVALGSEANSQINIEGNNFIATGTSSCGGIYLGTASATYAFHNRIIGNLFSDFTAQDIYTVAPGKLFIENNRCLSTGEAASIVIGNVDTAPVFVLNNECAGTITYLPADLTSGKLILRNNLTSGTTLDKNFTIAGGVGISDAAAGATGLAFPATQAASADANTLDDYEEGTWTPAYTPETGTFTTITYAANRGGSYTKIGNQVFASGYIRTDAITVGTASGFIAISGLPFVISANAWNDSGSIGFADAFNVNHPSSTKTFPSTDRLMLGYRTAAEGASNVLQVSDLATGASSNFLFFSIAYTV